MDRRPDDTWLKAAALGCLWASAEIVLGSFLHNLRLPLVGYLMAGIGIVLMVSIGQLWPVPGLFWRAGLICALMKPLAPSAVIFAPMVAVVCQACLMDLAVRLFRRHAPGYLVGAMLAMSWNTVQLLLMTLIAYGPGAVDLYKAMIRWSEINLGLAPGRAWTPVLLMLGVSWGAGLATGFIGLRMGGRAARRPLPLHGLTEAQVMKIRLGRRSADFPYSRAWLAADLVLVAVLGVLIGYGPWIVWLPAGAAALAVWMRRYRDAIRPLLRPRFWIWFILLTTLSGALLSSLKSGRPGLWAGIAAGLAMNFRAAVLVVGFSAAGTELRSPRVESRLYRGRLGPPPAILEAAVETLPLIMARLPKAGDIVRRPADALRRAIAQADFWFKRLVLRQMRRGDVWILARGASPDASARISALIDGLRADGRHVAGILSPPVFEGGRRIGNDVIDLASGGRAALSRIADPADPDALSVGRYVFLPDGLEAGRKALSSQAASADVIVVDEVGPWELMDQGWASSLYDLALGTDTPMIWIVRSDIKDQVAEHWGLSAARIVELTAAAPDEIRRNLRDRRPEEARPEADGGPAFSRERGR